MCIRDRVVKAAGSVGLTDNNLVIDVSIARGLDYYTGTIVETFLDDLPSIGSVCSGGRYDNLAQLYTKQELPGIGASLGLDRLLAAMQELDMIPPSNSTADVLIVQFEKERLNDYLAIAADLRTAGINTEIYPEAVIAPPANKMKPKKLNQQFKYANRRGFKAVIIAGGNELANGVVKIKWMADGVETEVPLASGSADISNWLREKLG